MVSLRDPVRDNMLFVTFAQGATGGCVLLAVLSFLDFRRAFGKLSYVPLLGSFVLSVALILFGYGPGASDAKVNLFGFQPVEIIRILLILFLAGYFAQRWEVLRHARETRPKFAWLSRYVDIPPLEYVLPVLACVVLSLAFFFLQKDLGPALVFTCLFWPVRDSARQRPHGRERPRTADRGLRGRLYAWSAAHRRRARLHVARAMEQQHSRRRPTGPVALGFATGGAAGTGPGWAIRLSFQRRIPTWCSRPSERSGASSESWP